jgi:formamidase
MKVPAMYAIRVVSLLCLVAAPGIVPAAGAPVAADRPDIVVVGGEGATCLEDPGCINRLHPDIPMAARARPGQTLLFRTRDAGDKLGTVASQGEERPVLGGGMSRVHPVTGPVFIEGARAGDVLKVTLTAIDPGRWAWTIGGSSGFIADRIEGEREIIWRLTRDDAVSDGLPGVRIPNASFPGVVTTLPGPAQHATMLAREQALANAGGSVFLPDPTDASPAALCGPDGPAADTCLRTIPPREHGGNMDIRHLQAGVSIYLPCFIDGCGLAIGDLHYAQGDGEVSGTAIEMSADVWATTEIVTDGPDLRRGPHYEGAARLLDIPSRRFYAVTGLPLKAEGETPPDMAYLESATVAGLENLSNNIDLAARNAVEGIVEYIVASYGFDRHQAYMIASVAVDIRIAQLVDSPNFGVTAILPLDIFH